jgi:hypothetical protein
LAAVRGLAETERTPLRRIVTAPPPAVPPSNGHSHEEYGRILKVPGIDRRRGAGSVHLWHIIDDVELLHRVLALGIETWGQWHTIVEHGGGLGDDAQSDAYHRTAARANLIDSLGQLWRIGRGLPLNRHVIRESSGNPYAINNWDSNAAAGTPSQGLLQVIDPTFAAYHVAGTSYDPYDPIANITAACNYAAARYGSIDNVFGAY